MKFQSLHQVDEFGPKRAKRKSKKIQILLSTFTTVFLFLSGQNSFAQDSTTTSPSASAQPATPENTSTTTTTTTTKDHSSSGLFVEPILLGASENMSMKTAQLPLVNSNTSGTASGYGVGLRLGGHITNAIFIGVDGRYDKEQMQDSFYQSANAEGYNYGPTVGVQMPYLGLRLMGTYVMGGQLNPTPGAYGLDLNFKDARGWRAGAGVHLGPVSVNLEYQDLTYGTTQVESLGSLPVNTNVSMQTETTGYLLSLSFPMML
jgi:hypothetical protein